MCELMLLFTRIWEEKIRIQGLYYILQHAYQHIVMNASSFLRRQ